MLKYFSVVGFKTRQEQTAVTTHCSCTQRKNYYNRLLFTWTVTSAVICIAKTNSGNCLFFRYAVTAVCLCIRMFCSARPIGSISLFMKSGDTALWLFIALQYSGATSGKGDAGMLRQRPCMSAVSSLMRLPCAFTIAVIPRSRTNTAK